MDTAELSAPETRRETPATAQDRVLGFLDLGTNSLRILVVRINANRSYSRLLQPREMVRLGEGVVQSQQLQPAAMDRAVTAARGFGALARALGAEQLFAVATSATRDAENQDVLLRRMEEEAHVDLRVVSGLEEARLIHLGVASGMSLGDRRAVFIDIGGGSTEVILGDQRQHYALDSLKLGAIRLATLYSVPGETGPVAEDRYELMKRYVAGSSVRTVQHLRSQRPDLFVGSSGTIMNLAEITLRRTQHRSLERLDILPLEDLRETIRMLRALPLEQRRRVPGINPERADIIVPGAAILETLLECLGAREIVVSDRGLREGLLADYLDRINLFQGMSVRQQSVFQLGRSCGFEEGHARRVETFALGLFDDAAALGLHRWKEGERELLAHAGLLHDIGLFIAFSNHAAHTHYIIRHAEMLGFDQREIRIMALLTLYHRKKIPKKAKKLGDLGELEKRDRRLVEELSVFLRLGENLERSRTEVVRTAHLAEEGKTLVLELRTRDECPLEVWGVQEPLESFAQIFSRPVTLRVVRDPSREDPDGDPDA